MKKWTSIFLLLLPALLIGQVKVGTTIAKTTATATNLTNESTGGFWHKPASGYGHVYLGPSAADIAVVIGYNDAFAVKFYDGSWITPIEVDALGSGLHVTTGLNLHLATSVEVVDSLQIGNGAWLRKVFFSTTKDSLGVIYYNATRVRADTVWLVQ